MIFVDTSVWFAAYVEEEREHAEADAILTAPASRLVTTDYVIDELLTLFVARGQRPIARTVGGLLWSGDACQLNWTERFDVEAAWQIFEKFDDKSWSFTDCVSHVVMQRLGIHEVFAVVPRFQATVE
jgi:predicted nucleic acid-binding protein